MIVSPLDYELYSRVTGQPIPMSAAERMKMAPVVNEFTKNYTKSRGLGAMGKNILKIGALGAGLGAAYLAGRGSRDFGTPSQELGQDLVETSTASNLVQNAAEKAAAVTASNTISQSLSTDQTPEQTLENAAETTTEPSQLNINAALEKKDAPLPSAEKIRRQYSKTVTSPSERQERNVAALVGGGEYYLGQTVSDGEVIKTEDSSGFDDKGKSILNKYVGMMKDGVDENLKELTGPTAPDFEQTLVSDSPLTDHPDVVGGEDDIKLPGAMNTSPTTNLAYIDPKKVMAMAVSVSEGAVKQPLTPEEKLIVAAEIEKKRTPNLLEKRAIDNESAMDSMRLTDEEREKESIRLGSTGGIPNKTDMAKIRKSPEFIAAQESMKPKSTGEKVDDFTAKFVEGAKSDIVRGRMGNKSLGITRIPPTNGDSQVGFVLANKPIDQSPKFAETYAYGVAPDAESMLGNQLDEKSFSTYMQRAMKESKKGKKRQAGEIFEYLTPDARIIEGDARLGDIEM